MAAGARGEVGGFGTRAQGSTERTDALAVPATDSRIMSSFTGNPPQGVHSMPNGPLLVMPPPQEPRRTNLWLKRAWLVIFVLFCLEIGIILTVLPWTRVWTENSLLLGHPQVREFLQQNFVRGLVSGLGLVDIWMGIAEAVRYHEGPDS